MSEKMTLSSRFFSCLVVASTSILIFSSIFLFRFNSSSSNPTSLLKLYVSNSTSPCLKSTHETIQHPLQSKTAIRTVNFDCQSSRLIKSGSQKLKPFLKVYMYELPPEFHFGLLGWKGNSKKVFPNVDDLTQIPSYPGGLNLQHSIEYWLTLDLLASNTKNLQKLCGAIWVQNSTEADIMFVPFFSSLSYNRHSKIRGTENISINRMLQDKLVKFLKGRDEWNRFGGTDHLIMAHHPNSMLAARNKLGSAMFLLADFGRYPSAIANLEKDVIAPYRHMVKTVDSSKSASYEERPILVYFQGAIYRKDGGVIRQELYYLLKEEKDVHFTFGSIRSNGVHQAERGMASSKFCLNIAGDTPSSNRLFDAIASHCVPVIISDDIELPFEDVLDYTEFCIFVRSTDAIIEGYLLNLLRGVKKDKWTKMWGRLKQIVHHFEYQFPSHPGDAVNMIWEAVSRKRSLLRENVHRKNRYVRSPISLKKSFEIYSE